MTTYQPMLSGLSIATKISILVGSVAALSSFVVGTLIVRGSSEVVYQYALDQLKFDAKIKSISLVSTIRNLSEDTRYLVRTPPIEGIPRANKNSGVDPVDGSSLETWRVRLTTLFSELIRAKPSYLQIRYIGINDGGKELLRVERRGDEISRTPENELQYKGDTTYFKEAILVSRGKVYLSDINLNREHGKITEPHVPVIRAASPVYFDGKLYGIVVINMAIGRIIDDLIEKTPIMFTAYVTNKDGYFLSHPNKSITYGFEFGNDNRIQTVYPNFDSNKMTALYQAEYTVNTNNDVVHVDKAYYDPEHKDRCFAVMVAASHANLQAKSAELRYQGFLITGFLVVLSMSVAAFLASRLMRPLQLITKASGDLANGREIRNLPLTSVDEIGELARSFDDMRHQLEEKKREVIVSQGHVHYANKMASLGEMAGGIAHEINSPMQTIGLIAQRVQRQLKKSMSVEEIESSMAKITTSVKKISEIIESLRNVSRDSSRDPFVNVRIGDIVKDTANMSEERFRFNNVRFNVTYHKMSEDTHIQCQHLQISQVLINLVNNAYDAIQSLGEKWIKIDVSQISDKIQISVTDSGPGISENIVERIFEPMFTTKEIGRGTGLGLSISSEIIAKHNGLLYVDKACSHTRFVIELPFVYNDLDQS